MASTNKTPNFQLPRFVANDVPSWLVDVNGAFMDIDTDMKSIQDTAQSASGTATGAASQVDSIQSTVDSVSENVSTLSGTVATHTTQIGALNSSMTEVQGDITEIQGNISDIQGDIANLENSQGVTLYTHQKQGTIHVLTGDANAQNIKFFATANYTEGDTFLVNGTSKTVVTMNGQTLPDDFFVSGAGVMALLSGSNIYFF